MDQQYDEATAYHEAGHAVAALALGRPVQRVSILPNRERLGHCEFGKGVFRPSEDWLEREILIALGGLAAEARYTGAYAWNRAERLERRLLAKAEHLLSQEHHWRAVELIAAELLRQGAISGRAARALFDLGNKAC